jgi:hypothetical protein
MGIDLGSFSSMGPMLGGMGGRGNPQFSLNGDAPPFYGSSYGDGRGGMSVTGGPPQRPAMPPFGAAGGNPSYAPPGGFSPYGVGRLPSPSPLMQGGQMNGNRNAMPPQQQQGGAFVQQQGQHTMQRNPNVNFNRGGGGVPFGSAYSDTF